MRLVDFGVSRHYDPFKDGDTVRLGTPGYAAPEQYRKKGQSTPRSDIYALGVVLFQLFSFYDPSTTPFRFPCLKKMNPFVSDELKWIINKATSLDQRDRYLDTGLFMEELTDLYEEKYGSYESPYSLHLPYLYSERRTLSSILRSSLRLVMKPFLWSSAFLYSIWFTSSFLEKISLSTALGSSVLFFLVNDQTMSGYLYFFRIANIFGFLASRFRIFNCRKA